MSLVQTSKFGPQAPLPLPLVTSATAITFLPPCSGTKGLPHPGTRASVPHHYQHPGPRPLAPGPGTHLWKAWWQHWYTSKLLLLRVVFRRDTQSTAGPLGM